MSRPPNVRPTVWTVTCGLCRHPSISASASSHDIGTCVPTKTSSLVNGGNSSVSSRGEARYPFSQAIGCQCLPSYENDWWYSLNE